MQTKNDVPILQIDNDGDEWGQGFTAGIEYVRAQIDLLKLNGVTDIETIIARLRDDLES